MDSALRKIIKDYPALFLVAPPETKPHQSHDSIDSSSPAHYANSEEEVDSVPPSIKYAVSTILRFMSILLRNSYNKQVFNSVREATVLLAVADDDIASLALTVLASLALPAQSHRMSVPDTSQNGTVLHNAPMSITHSRLLMLSKGWGSRGSGLGLATCVTTDDSIAGQGSLPQYAGEVRFDFLPPSSKTAVHVQLSSDDICLRHSSRSSYAALDKQVEKKRKTGTAMTTVVGGPASSDTKSTAHLFFNCLNQIGGRENIGPEKLFELLVHIRLAKSFHSRSARIRGVELRLQALLTILYTHPSYDTLAGYFHAQPELCVELTDLIQPIVSQSAVSSMQSLTKRAEEGTKDLEYDARVKNAFVKSIVDPYSAIPYEIRILSLEVLTALVGRKDDVTANGTPYIARQADVLGELGVTKGQHSGLLITLIRYSLASLKSFAPRNSDRIMSQDIEMKDTENMEEDEIEEFVGLKLGVAFVQATRPQSVLETDGEEKALEFISAVLTLAFAVVTVSTGTSTLTECGLIPVLISSIMCYDTTETILLSNDNEMDSFKNAMYKFVTAEVIQLLEGAITNNNQALSAFHELNGITILVKNLCTEIQLVQVDSDSKQSGRFHKFTGPNRALMYSIFNCLTVVFHLQETTSRTNAFPITSGDVLRKEEVTKLLIEIMDNVSTFGGVIASLAVTFLADTMNSDPRVVHYVYQSGIANSFFCMLKSKSVSNDEIMCTAIYPAIIPQLKFNDEITSAQWNEPIIPQSAELISALGPVITALALTEEGRDKIAEINPVPAILGICASPRYSMPITRCMTGDMASMIGSGLDELIRHVPNLKDIVIKSIVSFIKRVVHIGEKVIMSELECERNNQIHDALAISNSRIQFIHYAHNVSHILEQVLQTDEHCKPFSDFGGVEALLELHPLLMTSGTQFLSHISTQTSPSMAILSHSTIAVAITTAIKRVASNDRTSNILIKVKNALSDRLEHLEESIRILREKTEAPKVEGLYFNNSDYRKEMDTTGILEGVPRLPLHLGQNPNIEMIMSLSCFLREIVNIEWITLLLSSILKMSSVHELGRSRNHIFEEISSTDFQVLLNKLATLFRCSLYEVCRVRSDDTFNSRDKNRWKAPGESNYHPATYRLRIVCAEGAVVRDGIDIDSCASVGGLEMGEEVDAFDRCINGSGIMRYRTAKGWVSEQTRGHSREPISEVLGVNGVAPKRKVELFDDPKTKKAIDCGLFDLCAASASVLARLQNSQNYLYTYLSRATLSNYRATIIRHFGQETTSKSYITTMITEVSKFLRSNFDLVLKSISNDQKLHMSKGGEAMYLGNMLNIFHSCIYEERRDRVLLNVLIFSNILIHDGLVNAIFVPDESNKNLKAKSNVSKQFDNSSLYRALRNVLQFCLEEMSMAHKGINTQMDCLKYKLSQSKVVASCFTPAVSLLRRLVSQSLLMDSQVNSHLEKIDGKEFLELVASDCDIDALLENKFVSFRHHAFARSVHSDVSYLVEECWGNKHFKFAPPHALNPLLALLHETFISLEISIAKETTEQNEDSSTRSMHQIGDIIGSQGSAVNDTSLSQFNPNEDTIRRMINLGFTRNQALNAMESSQSNVVEVAMEYALTHPPSNNDSTRGSSSSSSNEVPDSQNSESIENIITGQKLSFSEKKKLAENQFDKQNISLLQDRLKMLKNGIVKIALDIIEGQTYLSQNCENKDEKTFVTDAEVTNLLVGNFLLDFYEKYHLERLEMINHVLDRMKVHFIADAKGNHKVKDGSENSLASICHILVLFARALPIVRTSILKRNVLSSISQCVRSFSSNIKHSKLLDQKMWPCWLAPCLLLVDIMAEPMTLEKDDNVVETSESSTKDYERVLIEHRKQQSILSKTSKRIYLALDKAKTKQKKKIDNTKDDPSSPDQLNLFSNIPTFAPLLTQEMAESLLISCLHILRSEQKKVEFPKLDVCYIPPSIAHSLLLILTKVLQFPKAATLFLRMGGTDLLLSLQHKSRFKGHVPLVILAFRRVMEDENTLQNIMESELRSIISKRMKKRNHGSNTNNDSLPSRIFIESVSHLICRDPIVFLKAATTSIKIIPSSNTGDVQHITLLSPEERAKNTKAIADFIRSNNQNNASAPQTTPKMSITETPSKRGRQQKSIDEHKALKSKSPHRGKSPHRSTKKAQKREKQEKLNKIIGSPISYVTTQILTALVRCYHTSGTSSIDSSFLSVVEYLEIIGDLLLAIPTCAGAIHGYQLNNSTVKVKHAISGKILINQNIINFLLHVLLPQPRDVPQVRKDIDTKDLKEEMKALYMKTKTAQNAARILVVLVARAGDGRKRVISELVNSLKLDDNVEEARHHQDHYDMKMWALKSWGELCLGLAAPRRVSNSHDTDSTLSFEVVKLMQEAKMAHGLINSVRYVNLEHPLAASTAGALLRPLENFTRPTVITTIKEMVKKSDKKKIQTKVDDSMIADGFDADEGNRNVPWLYHNSGDEAMDENDDSSENESNSDEEMEDSIIMSEDSEEDDDNDSDSDSEIDEEDDDEEISSENDSEESDSVDDDDDEIGAEVEHDQIDEQENAIDLEDVVDVDDQEDIAALDDVDDHMEDVDTGDFEMEIENDDVANDFFDANEDAAGDVEGNMDGDFDGDGWTSIETRVMNGFRNIGNAIGRPRALGGHGGLFLETAEHLIGNILRSGGLQMDELAEIEGTLGIRLHGSPPAEGFSRFMYNRSRSNNISTSNLSGQRQSLMSGLIPSIHQRSTPDNFYSSSGGLMRLGEPNFMEFQFGSPPLGSNDRMHYIDTNSEPHDSNGEDDEQFEIPRCFDNQLFPNGSAAATHPHVSTSIHPLLSSVNLPPSNSLFSRVTRLTNDSRHGTASNRTPNGWSTEIRLGNGSGFYVGESRPINRQHILAESRPNNRQSSSAHQVTDPMYSEFTRAFERALVSNPWAVQNRTNVGSSQEHNTRDVDAGIASSQGIASNSERIQEHNDVTNQTQRSYEDHNASDGENVASSLAANLTLSNRQNDVSNNLDTQNQRANSSSVNEANDVNVATTQDEQNNNNTLSAHDTNQLQSNNSRTETNEENTDQTNILTCPPGIDVEVFNQLPTEMQQEIIREHQASEMVAVELDAASGLDPEALAALPPEMRREVIEQEQNERRLQSQAEAPADPSNAEDMDNASFIASLAPELRREILLTADESVLNSLPPDIVAEARVLRERDRVSRQRRDYPPVRTDISSRRSHSGETGQSGTQIRLSNKKRNKSGKIRVCMDRMDFSYGHEQDCDALVTQSTLEMLISLMYLLSPVRPQKLLQKFFQNLVVHPEIRYVLAKVLISLLLNDPATAITTMSTMKGATTSASYSNNKDIQSHDFPPSYLLGTAPEIEENDNDNSSLPYFRRRRSAATAIASNLPISARCSASNNSVPPVVTRRLITTLTFLTKNGSRTALDILNNFGDTKQSNYLDNLLGLLSKDVYVKSSSNLDDLLGLIESICVPLSSIPTDNDTLVSISSREIEVARGNGQEWVDVPEVVVSSEKLKLLCSTLRLESCKDTTVAKVNNIARRLSKVVANRECIVHELASVAHSLSIDAKRDLRALKIRLLDAIDEQKADRHKNNEETDMQRIPSTAVTLSASNSEVKLLRVLRTLHSLCSSSSDDQSKKSDGSWVVREEFAGLLKGIDLGSLWDHLTSCLQVVSILEGVKPGSDANNDQTHELVNDDGDNGDNGENVQKLKNSVAGLLSRFLPIIEAFFVVNASKIAVTNKSLESDSIEDDIYELVGGNELIQFVALNKVLINAMLRSNPSYLDKGLRAMVKIPRCRPFLDFDVKRQWFRSQVGRLRKQAIRRHGSLRLTIRRQRVFEDTFHQLRPRDADEMRGRLHITFVNEEGVDAGGLSREFFGILAKEMFNPNYALFTSTEDGCTFQPNPYSNINPEHLSYFHFVGRIVGKALADGFLLDAHFTRSLYKHMLGLKVSSLVLLQIPYNIFSLLASCSPSDFFSILSQRIMISRQSTPIIIKT